MTLDGRARQHREDITSAAAHPELALGYIALPPRSPARLSPAERRSIGRWWRRMLGACAAIVASTLAFPLLKQAASDSAQAFERPHSAACAGWDDAASDAITKMVRGQGDADLRLIGDATFRMRRARRNCHMGWPRLACFDYQAIIRGTPGLTGSFMPTAFECSLPDGDATGQQFTATQTIGVRP